MNLFKKIPLTFENKDYEIRIYYDDTIINAAAFLNNHPVNGFRHQILIPKNCDAHSILEKGAALELIETCKNDITEKRWEKISEIIQEHKSTK